MFVLSRFRFQDQMPLKDNYFWLYNKYYLRVAEGGLYGLILLVVIVVELRQGNTDRPTIAAICATCTIKVLYCGLAAWSYFKMRQVKKAHETHVEKPQTEDPYVEMLLGFVSLPAWHILLSTFLIWLITTGFITTPTALISLAEDNNNTSLFKQFSQSEPRYVQFHFTALMRRIWFSKFFLFLFSKLHFYPFFHSISVLMLTNHQVCDRHLDILRWLYRDVCSLPLSIFEEQPLLALPQILSVHGRGWHLWGDLIAREHLCVR
jgi:hypothetical protein